MHAFARGLLRRPGRDPATDDVDALIDAGSLSPLTGNAALDRLIVRYSQQACPTTTGEIVAVASFRDPNVASGQCAYSADHFTAVLRAAGFAAHVDHWDDQYGVYPDQCGPARPSVASQLCDAMLVIVDERDSNTGAHERTVGLLAQAIARELGLSAVESELVVQAAEVHDIGKVATPDTILRKRGRLTPEERELMQQHSIIGARMLTVIPSMAKVSDLVRHHHERWDGTGYPDRLAGETIPLGARILAVADSYEAMTADRSYRARMSPDEATIELQRCAGSQFDPDVVDAFARIIAYSRNDAGIPRHYFTVVEHEGETSTIDWTASQLGDDAFPLVRRQHDDGTWAQAT